MIKTFKGVLPLVAGLASFGGLTACLTTPNTINHPTTMQAKPKVPGGIYLFTYKTLKNYKTSENFGIFAYKNFKHKTWFQAFIKYGRRYDKPFKKDFIGIFNKSKRNFLIVNDKTSPVYQENVKFFLSFYTDHHLMMFNYQYLKSV